MQADPPIHCGAFSLTRTERGLELLWQGRSLLGPLRLAWELGLPGEPPRVVTPTEAMQLGSTPPAADGPDAGTPADALELRYFVPELPGVTLTARLELGDHGLTVSLGVVNRSPSVLRLGAARLIGRPLPDTWLSGVGAQVAWRFFGLGFSTFSPAQSLDTRAAAVRPLFPSAATFTLHTQSPFYGQDGVLSTPWLGAFTRREGREPLTVVLAFLSATSGLGEVALLHGQPPIVEARLGLDGKRLPPGEAWTGDALRITAAPQGLPLLSAWAREAGARMQARPVPPELPTGWCSWYRYYHGVTEADVLHNLAALAEQRERLPVRYVQLDDGYQKKVGDWLEPNRKFRSGLGALAGRIRAAGFVPGIWTAPFFVQRGARLFHKHPEWLLHDPDGELRPVGYHPLWGVLDGQVYALDPTHPGALAHLRQVFTELCAAGFDYFKIDFLFAGLRLGRHYDQRLSPVEAYRTGLRAIREAIDTAPGAGAGGRYLLGCGAPLLPSAGLVDGMRISPDVKETWRDAKVAWLTRGASHPAAEQMLPSCMTRSFLHGALWANDPDCLLVRKEASQLTLSEVQTLVSVLGLTGGLLVLSDDIAALSADRRALAELALPPLGEPALALDLLTEEKPERFVRLHRGAHGTEALVALVNWHDTPLEKLLLPGELGSELDPRASYHAFELWTERYERCEPRRPLHSVIPAHGTALWLLRPARPEPAEAPQLVTLLHHLGQTTALVLGEAWDAEQRQLSVRLRAPALRQGRVLISVPPGLLLQSAAAEGAAEVTGHAAVDGLLTVHLVLRPPERRGPGSTPAESTLLLRFGAAAEDQSK